MAKATKRLLPAFPVVPKYTVTLELSQNEAETLFAVTTRIGGVPEKSRRQFMDNIGKALSNAGVNAVDFKTQASNRAIYFLDEVFND